MPDSKDIEYKIFANCSSSPKLARFYDNIRNYYAARGFIDTLRAGDDPCM